MKKKIFPHTHTHTQINSKGTQNTVLRQQNGYSFYSEIGWQICQSPKHEKVCIKKKKIIANNIGDASRMSA